MNIIEGIVLLNRSQYTCNEVLSFVSPRNRNVAYAYAMKFGAVGQTRNNNALSAPFLVFLSFGKN